MMKLQLSSLINRQQVILIKACVCHNKDIRADIIRILLSRSSSFFLLLPTVHYRTPQKQTRCDTEEYDNDDVTKRIWIQ